MPSKDKVLISLVQKQTDLFNADASTEDKEKLHRQIQEYQKSKREGGS